MIRRMTPVQLGVDIAIAVACFLLRLTMTFDGVGAAVTVVAMASALAIRRLSPGIALAVAWVGAVVQMVSLLPADASNLAILAVLYTTARYGATRVRWLGLVSAGLGAVIATSYFLLKPYSPLPPDSTYFLLGFAVILGASLAVLGLSWTLGLLARTWANARQSRRDKVIAEREVTIEQERNRIARDMHDVVAHSLAVVIAQADGARYAARSDPTAIDDALTTIASTAREALGDVRMLLGQLRHNQESGPQPALADLDALVTQVRASGLDVSFAVTGTPLAMPTGAGLALYRIAQEALTNALRHGDIAQPVTARLAWGADDVTLSISNTVGSAPESDPGHGLTGMRERALLAGGDLSAQRDGARFLVTARIPSHAKVTA